MDVKRSARTFLSTLPLPRMAVLGVGKTKSLLCCASWGSVRAGNCTLRTPTRKLQRIAPSAESTTCREYGRGKKVIVVGAGPSGLLAALLLAQRGYHVDIMEKRPAPDRQEIKHGTRSIVFGLLTRGQAGLKEAGIRLPYKGQEFVWLNGLALSKGAYSHKNVNGKVTTTFSRLPSSVLIVERAALVEHMILEMQRSQPERICLLYGHSLNAIDFRRQAVAYLDDRGEQCSAHYELLVGCDGRNSFVRGALEQQDPDMRHEELVAFRSYKGYHRLPLLESEDLGDETGIPVTFHVTGGFLEFSATYWPTRHGTVTGHLSCPREWFGEKPNTPETYAALIRDKFPAFPEQWIPETCRQLVEAKASPNGASIKCTKLHGPRTVILGDAAHGVTPALGQGCNAALESAQIFVQVLDECDGDAEAAPERFSRARLQDAHALFALDREARSRNGADGLNFIRLSGLFHILLGTALKKLLPFWFKGSAYSTLMGSKERYSKVKRALRRDALFFVLSLATAIVAVVRLLQAALSPLASGLMSGVV